MHIRIFILSSPKRITEINQHYQVHLPESMLNQQFIHIQNPTKAVIENLQLLRKEHTDFEIFTNPNQDQIVIPLDSKRNNRKYMRQLLPDQNIPDKTDLIKPWIIRNQILDFNKDPILMGILNVTPDSFSDGGLYNSDDDAVERALQMEAQGAKIIDIGGESTRPGSNPVSEVEELSRVVPVIERLRGKSDVVISVDTIKSEVARAALMAGADIVNDISALEHDPKMSEVVRAVDCPVVIMHMQGTPKNMQDNPVYVDVSAEVYAYFHDRLSVLRKTGIKQIALDPGIGFGKRVQDNLQLLRDLQDFKQFNLPVLIGLSRKSFIGSVLDIPVDQRLAGTLSANLFAARNGASILRVHDVRETRDALKMYNEIEYS